MDDSPLCQFLPWDTEFFGVRIARLVGHRADGQRLSDALAWCRSHGIECLYFLADSDDRGTSRSAESHGFHLTDVRVTFRHTLAGELACPDGAGEPEVPVRMFRADETEALVALVQDSFSDSRFYYDPRFSRERCRALYETWVRRSCEGGAEAVFVAGPEASPLAYVTCHLRDGGARAEIGLIGVAPAARGHGLGPRLVRHVLHWGREQGTTAVDVVTQGRNIAAQRLYQRCGFLTRSVQFWYHRWLTDEPDY